MTLAPLVLRDVATAPTSRATCMVALARDPTSLAAVTSCCTAAFAVDGALAIPPMLLVFVVIAWIASGSQRVRRATARAEHRRQRTRVRDQRIEKLTAVGAPRSGLAEATRLVDAVEHHAPEDAARFDLEELLDHFVAVTVVYTRYAAMARINDTRALQRRLDDLVRRDSGDGMRHAVLERRLAFAERCETRMVALGQELDCILEVLRLLAERAAMSAIDDDDGSDVLADRVALLDEEDE